MDTNDSSRLIPIFLRMKTQTILIMNIVFGHTAV